MKITYQKVRNVRDMSTVKVDLDGKHVGTIKQTHRGWEYFPKGTRTGGAVFQTLDACKASLEITEPRYLGPTANEVLAGSKVLTGSEVLADVLERKAKYEAEHGPTVLTAIIEVLADAKPTYTNTYWNRKGKHEAELEAIQKLVPASGEVPNANLHPALEQFRKASNCYYDLYNNGLWNRANEYREVFGIDAFDRAADDMDTDRLEKLDLTQELIDHTEGVMDEIILAAYAEQFPPTPTGETIDITPVGCQTPEGANRVAKAMREFDAANASVANAATAFIKEWDWYFKPGNGRVDRQTLEAFANELGDLKLEISIRERTQEAFLRAVAGAPEAQSARGVLTRQNSDRDNTLFGT